MKKVLCLVLTAMLLLAASAASAATQLEMLCWMGEQQEGIDAMVDAFNASQKDIELTVSYMSKSAYFEKLNIGLPAGSAPDIIALNVPSDIDYSKRGFLLDISDLFESGAIDLSRYPKHTIDAHTIDGVLHGVPRDYDSIAVYYNKAIFDAAGEPYPTGDWTWEEFVEVAKRITRADEGIYGTCVASYPNSVVYDMVYSNGGKAFDENGLCVLNSAEAKDALKKLSDVILVEHASPTIEEQAEMSSGNRFLNGMAGMLFNGSWSMASYAEALGDDLGVCALPAMGEKPASISHSLIWAIPACSQNIDAAKTFLTYLASYESQAMTAATVIPAYEGTDALWVENYAQYGAKVFTDMVSEGYAVSLPYSMKASEETYSMIKSGFADVLATGDADLLDGLTEAVNAKIAE